MNNSPDEWLNLPSLSLLLRTLFVEVRTQIIQWVQDGAPEHEWEPKVKILFKNNCTQCHGNIPGLPDFNKLEVVKHISEIV